MTPHAHLVLLEQVLNAPRQRLDSLRFCLHHLVKVKGDVLDDYAVMLEVLRGVLEQVRAMQQCLGGDAAHIQASASQGSARFHASRLRSSRIDCKGCQ